MNTMNTDAQADPQAVGDVPLDEQLPSTGRGPEEKPSPFDPPPTMPMVPGPFF
jgi:hypothetical protein